MESSLNCGAPPDLNGCFHSAYGGAITSEPNTRQQQHYSSGRKKSKVRLNDQLIPKPTDINLGDKVIKIAAPKEHPYLSHTSRFAMFPSFRSPDDPETGVRAASQPFLNPLVPNRAPDVNLLSKTMGGPCRHEVLETPMKTRRKAVTWTGERGFLDLAKPLKGENQVFYPTPPKAVLPNPQLRKWDMSLSERTSNMLKNLERTHWVTSYQMQYTGSGPANPIKTDDFKEKLIELAGMSSHAAPLRERSFPVFVPSKPRGGCRRRQGSCAGRSTCSASAAELSTPAPAPNRGGASATINHRPGRPLDQCSRTEVRTELRVKDEPSCNKERFEAARNVSSLSRPVVAKHLVALELPQCREVPHNISNPGILPRPPAPPGIPPVDGVGTAAAGRRAALSLLELQNSFSKSAAHRNFNSSVTRAAVNPRDNVATGKKHDFYGINCYYLHG